MPYILIMGRDGQPTEAAGLLIEVGRSLYGYDWIPHLARDLGVSPHTLRAMRSGKFKLSADHGILTDALRLLHERRDDAERRGQREKAAGLAADAARLAEGIERLTGATPRADSIPLGDSS